MGASIHCQIGNAVAKVIKKSPINIHEGEFFTNKMNVRIEQGWEEALAAEFEKPYFQELTERVRRFYADPSLPSHPDAGRIFAAFDASPFDKTRVVILGQDPYHGPNQANGLAFSVNPGIPLPPSLKNIYTEIENEFGAAPTDGDLSGWARQGVLLLNATLTVGQGMPKSHAGIGWEQFTDAAVAALASRREGIVYMLWGSDAARKGALIPRDRNLVLTAPHPSPLSAYRGFFGCGHFKAANRYLEQQGLPPIDWTLAQTTKN